MKTHSFPKKWFLISKLTSILFLLLVVLQSNNTRAQKAKKETDSLKNALRITTDKLEKITTIYKLLHLEYKNDIVLFYTDKGIALSKDYDNDWLSKFYIFKANSFSFKERDSIYHYFNLAISTTTDTEIKAKVYGSMANLYLNRRQADSTAFYIKKFFELKPQNIRVLANGLYVKAWLYSREEDYQKAIFYTEEAIALTLKHNVTANTCAYYHQMARIRYNLNQYDLAIQELEKALILSDKNSYAYGQTLSIMSKMTASLKPQNPVSIDYMKRAVTAFIADDSEYFLIASGYKNLASRYLDHNKNEEALENLKKFKKYIQKTTDIDYYQSIYMIKMGHYFNNINKLDSAYTYLTKSLSLIKKNSRLKSYEIGALFQMALTLKKLKRINKAKKIFIKTTKSDDYLSVSASYYNLYEINQKQKNYKKALEWHLKHKEIQDEILKGEKENVLAELLVKYDTKEKQNSLLKAELKNKKKDVILKDQKQRSNAVLIISTSVILLLISIFNIHKSRKEYKLEIALKSQKEIATLKKSFIENLSREITTPITIINGYLGLIEKNSIHPAEVVKYTRIGQKNTELLENKFNSFLSLIDLYQDQKLNETIKTEHINKHLRELTDSFSPITSAKNIGLYYKSNITDNLILSYNHERIDKILHNLITNALRFTNSKNNIFIEVEMVQNSLSIVIKDEGIGIAKDEQKLIFDRLYQSKKNKKSGGFGIGLSLAKELITSLNGTIELESQENIGSIFKVILPLETIENIELYLKSFPPDYIELSKITETITVYNNKFPKVLIVEDSLEMITYLKTLLGSFLECHEAHNGKEALLQIEKTDFDLIISDYRTPIMDGKELKIELNKSKEYEDIPFILLSSVSIENITNLKLSLGISDYILKPFGSNELITRIRGALENKLMLMKIQNKDEKLEFDGHVSDLLDKINTFVLENISETSYSVGDLASDCGYGQKQFSKIIKDKTGMNPVNLILEIRLLKAYEFLMNKKYATIMEVIYAVGLTNRSYFNKAFMKRFGIKPKDSFT